MRRIPSALCFAALLAGAAAASERPDTRRLSCAAVQALVAQRQDVVLASSASAYEIVHADGGACLNGDSGRPAYLPASDAANCFAGWRCTQRSSDGSGR